MSSDTDSSGNSKIGDSLSLLEKLTKFRFALHILSLALALDIVLSRSGHKGVLDLDLRRLYESATIGQGIVFVAAYSMFMSVLAVGLRVLTEWLCLTLDGWLPFMTVGDRTWKYRDRTRHVFPHEVRDLAVREKDPFAMKIYEDHMRESEQRRCEWNNLSNLSFACALLIGVDLCLPGEGASLNATISFIWSFSDTLWGQIAQTTAAILWLVVAGPWLYYFINPDCSLDWIDYPPAADPGNVKPDGSEAP